MEGFSGDQCQPRDGPSGGEEPDLQKIESEPPATIHCSPNEVLVMIMQSLPPESLWSLRQSSVLFTKLFNTCAFRKIHGKPRPKDRHMPFHFRAVAEDQRKEADRLIQLDKSVMGFGGKPITHCSASTEVLKRGENYSIKVKLRQTRFCDGCKERHACIFPPLENMRRHDQGVEGHQLICIGRLGAITLCPDDLAMPITWKSIEGETGAGDHGNWTADDGSDYNDITRDIEERIGNGYGNHRCYEDPRIHNDLTAYEGVDHPEDPRFYEDSSGDEKDWSDAADLSMYGAPKDGEDRIRFACTNMGHEPSNKPEKSRFGSACPRIRIQDIKGDGTYTLTLGWDRPLLDIDFNCPPTQGFIRKTLESLINGIFEQHKPCRHMLDGQQLRVFARSGICKCFCNPAIERKPRSILP